MLGVLEETARFGSIAELEGVLPEPAKPQAFSSAPRPE